MGDPIGMADHLRLGKGSKEGTAPTGLIDVDMGEEDLVKLLYPKTPQFGQEVWKRREGAGIDEKGQAIVAIKPGTDKFSKARLGGQIEVNADRLLVRHVSLLG